MYQAVHNAYVRVAELQSSLPGQGGQLFSCLHARMPSHRFRQTYRPADAVVRIQQQAPEVFWQDTSAALRQLVGGRLALPGAAGTVQRAGAMPPALVYAVAITYVRGTLACLRAAGHCLRGDQAAARQTLEDQFLAVFLVLKTTEETSKLGVLLGLCCLLRNLTRSN